MKGRRRLNRYLPIYGKTWEPISIWDHLGLDYRRCMENRMSSGSSPGPKGKTQMGLEGKAVQISVMDACKEKG
jgi:hypothetical protein